MRHGYLTWKDTYSSDFHLELEFVVTRRQYQRRTVFGFRRMPITPQFYWIVGGEGHEIADIGPISNV